MPANPSDRTVQPALIVGAGPTGLWLAAELALAGVPVTVLERLPTPSPNSKALGIMPRTLELLALRDAVEPFLSAGRAVPGWHFGMLETQLDFQQLDSPYPFMLALPQTVTETVLERRALDLGATILRGTTVRDVQQTADQVTVTVDRNGQTEIHHAALLIGCDGARSIVRTATAIPFDGESSTRWGFLADVSLTDPPQPGLRIRRPDGALIVVSLPDGSFRITGWDPDEQGPDGVVSLGTLRALSQKLAGTDFGIHQPRWMSRFGNANRIARRYRCGRVLLAGDAAHIHWPTGGLGLNAGMQDSMNLGWRAAAFLQGTATEAALDAYDAERRRYGQMLATSTLAQGALITADTPEQLALRAVMNDLLGTGEGNRATAESVSGINVAYPGGTADPLVGRRYAAVAGGTASDSINLFASGRPVLLIDDPEAFASRLGTALGRPDRVEVGDLPTQFTDRHHVGVVLVRPDGYIAWSATSAADLETAGNEPWSSLHFAGGNAATLAGRPMAQPSPFAATSSTESGVIE